MHPFTILNEKGPELAEDGCSVRSCVFLSVYPCHQPSCLSTSFEVVACSQVFWIETAAPLAYNSLRVLLSKLLVKTDTIIRIISSGIGYK